MDRLEDIFKALGDQTRLRLVNLLLKQELCVCELVEALNLPQPKVSRHLGILKDAGLVLDRREAQMVFYRLNLGEAVVQKLETPLAQVLKNPVGCEDLQHLKEVLGKRINNVCCPGIPRTGACCQENG